MVIGLTAYRPPGRDVLAMPQRAAMNTFSRYTAVAIACLSGTCAAIGLCRFCPGSEPIVLALAALIEAAKLAVLHQASRQAIPTPLRTALISAAVVLMGIDALGLAGQLSHAYEQQVTASRASSHTTASATSARATALKDEIRTVDERIATATAGIARARDRDQLKALRAVLDAARAERARLTGELAEATDKQAGAEGQAIQAGEVSASVAFLAAALHIDQDTVAHAFILLMALIPECLAALLPTSSSCVPGEGPVPVTATLPVAPAVSERSEPVKRKSGGGVKSAGRRRRRRPSATRSAALKASWVRRKAAANPPQIVA